MGSHRSRHRIGIGGGLRRRRPRHEVGLRLERHLPGRQEGRGAEVLVAHPLQQK